MAVFGEDVAVLFRLKLVGICFWMTDKGHLFVTLPAEAGNNGRYFEYLRPALAGNGTVKALKEEVLRQWEDMQAAVASVA